MHTNTNTHARTHTYACTHVHLYTHTHTHTHLSLALLRSGMAISTSALQALATDPGNATQQREFTAAVAALRDEGLDTSDDIHKCVVWAGGGGIV